MAVLDTTVIVDLMRRSGQNVIRAREVTQRLLVAGEILYTTRANVAELWVGIELSQDRAAEEQRVLRALQAMVILEIGESESRTFGRISAHLRRVGRPAGDFDVLIASVALTHGQALVTRNPRHFADIPALRVISY